MENSLQIQVIKSEDLTKDRSDSIIALCNQAFEEDLGDFFLALSNPTHVLGFHFEDLVSHALWVTRWLQIDSGPLLRTAYVEALATNRDYRGRGYASKIMRRITQEIQPYDLGALSPYSVAFYERLGWELWRGPLYIRTKTGIVRTPRDGDVMILRLPNSPAFDLYTSLSAEWREGELW